MFALAEIPPRVLRFGLLMFVALPASAQLTLKDSFPQPRIVIAQPEPFHRSTFFGRELALIGDVDGDGRADALIANDLREIDSVNLGEVWLHPGSADGLSEASTVSFRGDVNDAYFGIHVARIGDFDGDGLADIGILGMADWGGQLSSTLHIWYGRQDWSQLASPVPALEADLRVRIPGASAGFNQFFVRGAGDIDGDGFDDLLVGLPLANSGGGGRVIFLPGNGTRPTGSINLLDLMVAREASSFLGADGVSNFGARIFPLGDLNNDGYADFGVTGIHPDAPGSQSLFVWYGRPQRWSPGSAALLAKGADWILLGHEGANFLITATAGDFDGDGHDDLAVSVWNTQIAEAGRVAIHPGGSRPAAQRVHGLLDQAQAIYHGSDFENGALGTHLASGDVNGDGRSELFISEPLSNPCNVNTLGQPRDCGRIYMLGGDADGLPTGEQAIDAVPHRMIMVNDDHMFRMGAMSSGADVDGDGVDDLLVGSVAGLRVFEYAGWRKRANWVAPGFNWVWRELAPLNQARYGHTANLLPDGRLVVIGGLTGLPFANQQMASAEIYDPTLDSWTLLPTPSASGRHGHTATTLDDGTVLVVGGALDFAQLVDHAEILDPTVGTWTPVPSPGPRAGHDAIRLADGQVLSHAGSAAQRFDPSTRTWGNAGFPQLARSRSRLAQLGSGNVLVLGGPLSSAERWSPSSNSWHLVTPHSPWTNEHPAAVGLPGGDVLLATNGTSITYRSSGGWGLQRDMRVGRCCFGMARTPGGVVVASGGFGEAASGSAEALSAGGWRSITPMLHRRDFHTLTALDDGRLIAVGGRMHEGTLAIDKVEALSYETVDRPDLALAASVTPLPDQPDDWPGGRFRIRIELSHSGDGELDATGIAVLSKLPVQLQVQGVAPSRGRYRSGSGLWDIESMESGGSAVLDIEASIIDGLRSIDLEHTASVIALEQGDADPSNDSASVTVSYRRADLRTLQVSRSGAGSGGVESQPGGIRCGQPWLGDCTTEFVVGSEVTLLASAAAGSTFAGWSGACTGVGTCVITMSEDTQVAARFDMTGGDPERVFEDGFE